MGTTAGGLPYPEPSDPVAAGADAIKALAQALDPKIAAQFSTLAYTPSVTGAGWVPGTGSTYVGRAVQWKPDPAAAARYVWCQAFITLGTGANITGDVNVSLPAGTRAADRLNGWGWCEATVRGALSWFSLSANNNNGVVRSAMYNPTATGTALPTNLGSGTLDNVGPWTAGKYFNVSAVYYSDI